MPRVDNIAVLSSGSVSETGTYEELLSQNQSFAQFLKTYFMREDLEEDEDDAECKIFVFSKSCPSVLVTRVTPFKMFIVYLVIVDL